MSLSPIFSRLPQSYGRTDCSELGTVLEEQPCNDPQGKTFVVADCKEVYLDHKITRLAGRLAKLTDEAAEQLLKITSTENFNSL